MSFQSTASWAVLPIAISNWLLWETELLYGAFGVKLYGLLDGNVDCCVPRTLSSSGAPEAGAAQLCHAELCWSQTGTPIITIMTAQLRFLLGRAQAVPYYLYIVQLKFLRTA